MTNRFYLPRLIFLLCAVLLLAAVIMLHGPRFWALPNPRIEPESGNTIGILTTIEIHFPQEMNKSSVEEKISFIPTVEVKKNWRGRTLEIMPVASFPMETDLTIQLNGGAISLDGKTYKADLKWTYRTRAPQIAYLGTATTSPEVWLVETNGRNRRQITHTSGNVTGFSPIPDGSGFFYSVKNPRGGSDLRRIDRNGDVDSIALECGKDTCSDPIVSRDSRLIAFSRLEKPENGTGNVKPHIYTAIITETQLKPTPLVGEFAPGGELPSFSPDGLKIAYYDSGSVGLRVINKAGENDFLLGTKRPQTASWSSDGSTLVFVDDEYGNEGVYSKVYSLDLISSTISEPLKGILTDVELGEPDLSPDGRLIALGVNTLIGSATRQMGVIGLADRSVRMVTEDFTRTNAAPIWRPDGGALTFQQAQIGASGAKPVVLVWDAKSGEVIQAANDAAMPTWLP